MSMIAPTALVYVMKFYSAEEQINVGSGEDLSIIDIGRIVARVVGFNGASVNDLTKPDGVARKLMNGDKLKALG
jgi:GDP-L-fucose synthase